MTRCGARSSALAPATRNSRPASDVPRSERLSGGAPMTDPIDQPSRIPLAPGVSVPESALRIQYSRSGGPGGQNVNKVNTRVQLWVPLAAITGLSERAVARLREQA